MFLLRYQQTGIHTFWSQNFLIFLDRLAPLNFVEIQQFNFVQLSHTRARNITLSKLEWKYTEKCSVVIVMQFSPPTRGLLDSPDLDSGAPLFTPLEMRELTPMVRLFKQSLSVGPSHSSD